jgi:Domain of unknown function (DUF3846)
LKVLRIDTNGNLTEVDLPESGFDGRFIAAVRDLVAAEAVQPLDLTSRWDAWLDEDGIAKGRPANPFAITLAKQYGISMTLRGTIVMTGVDREAGTAKSLTPEQIATIRNRIAGR